jgi:spore coat-associated protein N
MQKQILVSMAIIGVSAAALGAGTFALFTDPGNSSSNLFTASVLDLKLDGVQNVESTIKATSFMPGDQTSGSLALSHVGNLQVGQADLDVAFDLVLTDKDGQTTDMAKFLNVTELKYGTVDLLAACYTDANGNGWVDLDDLDKKACVDRAIPSGETFSMKVVFHTTAGNELQGDRVDMTMRFLLAQPAAEDLAA